MTIKELNLKTENTSITSQIHKLKVKQYLPLDDKFSAILEILNYSVDDNDFPSPIRVAAWSDIMLVKYYTDLDIQDHLDTINEEDYAKFYDLLIQNKVISDVKASIPPAEYETFMSTAELTVNKYYQAKNSIRGILESVTQDYSNLDLDASEIQDKLNNPENLAFLKKVVDRLG
jgi:hypothetical protein